jgi:hypothetical protein
MKPARTSIGLAAVAALSYALTDLLHEAAHAATTLLPLGVRALAISTVGVTTSQSNPAVAAAGVVANLLLGAGLLLSFSSSQGSSWRYFWWLFGSLNLFNATAYFIYSAALGSGDLAVCFAAFAPARLWRPLAAVVGLSLYVAAVRFSFLGLRGLVTSGVVPAERVAQYCMVPYWSGALLLTAGAAFNTISHWLILTSGAAVGFGAMAGLALLPPLLGKVKPPASTRTASAHFGWPWVVAGVLASLAFIGLFGPGLSLSR